MLNATRTQVLQARNELQAAELINEAHFRFKLIDSILLLAEAVARLDERTFYTRSADNE